LGEGVWSQTARPLDDRAQRFALADRVGSREAYLPGDSDGALSHPIRQLLDDQHVVWLEREIRGRAALERRGQIDRNDLRLTVLAVRHDVTGQLGAEAVRGGVETTARPDEIADPHAGLQRVSARRDGLAIDRDERRRGAVSRLRLQLLQNLRELVSAILSQRQDDDPISTLQHGVRSSTRRLEGVRRIRGEHGDSTARVALAPDQNVTLIRVLLHGTQARQELRQVHPWMPGVHARAKDLALQRDRVRHLVEDLRNGQDVSGMQTPREVSARIEVEIEHRQLRAAIDSLEPGGVRGGIGYQAACERKQVSYRGSGAHLVNGRPPDLPADAGGGTHRRHEDHITLLQLYVSGVVPVQKESIEIELAEQPVLPLDLHVSERADLGDTTGTIERVGDCGEAADLVGAGIADVAGDEDADGPQRPHGDARLDANQLSLNPLLDPA